jgi:hypothetical protein
VREGEVLESLEPLRFDAGDGLGDEVAEGRDVVAVRVCEERLQAVHVAAAGGVELARGAHGDEERTLAVALADPVLARRALPRTVQAVGGDRGLHLY